MAGIQNDQIFQPSGDAPFSIRIHVTLIAGVEPAVAQHRRRLLRTVPVAGKNIRAAHENFVVFADFHFDARNRGADASRLDVTRIVHRANGRGFREAVNLEHGNPQHHEKQLRFPSERRGTANQRAKIRSQAFANRRKNHEAGQAQPEKIPRLGRFGIEPRPRGLLR